MMEEIGPIVGRHAAWQLLRGQLEALGDELPVAVDVGAPVELDVDDREADARGRAHALARPARRSSPSRWAA